MAQAVRQKSLMQSRILTTSFPAYSLAVLGGLLYFFRSWEAAHSQASVLDEGAYLVKGYLFAIGKYWPYQDYGFWSNHMPLGFLIPGYVQAWFGPSLRTGRYFSILLGLLFLLGLWIATRRFGGRWWGAAAVWAVALNTALVKIYSQAISEGLIACLLVWVLVFTLGEGRPAWQILLGSLLAGAMAMTRLNLVPVIPVFLAYIFWQHGRREGLLACFASLGVILVGHVIYWPGILRLWATWIPTGMIPFLNRFRPPDAVPWWNPRIGLEQRALSFFLGIRFHFVAMIGFLATLVLWPKREDWKTESHFKASVFLVILLILLLALHAWASVGPHPQSDEVMGKDYCVSCFPLYLGFFSFLGLILIAASAGSWRWHMNGWLQGVVIGLLLLLTTGIGYAAFDDLDSNLMPLLNTRVPKVDSFRIQEETVRLKKVLRVRSGLSEKDFNYYSRRILSALAGLLFGLLAVFSVAAAALLLRRSSWFPDVSFGTLVLFFYLLLGFLLSPALILAGGYQTYDCSGNVLQRFEMVGSHLRQVIPPGSTVFWKGGDSAVPLLYLQGMNIFAPQVNSDYSYRLGGDSDALARYGFWNEELANQWAGQSDILLLEEGKFDKLSKRFVEEFGFDETSITPSTLPCRDEARILIYKK